MRFFKVPMGMSGIVEQWQDGGIDGGGIDQRLVALDVDDRFRQLSAEATSATRSVPDGWSARVIRTRAPKFLLPHRLVRRRWR